MGGDEGFSDGRQSPILYAIESVAGRAHFDDFVEGQCRPFYAEIMGRPGLSPGMYFRLLLIGYFEGIDSERGIAWRAADSFALRDFLGIGLEDAPPDHSTISRTLEMKAKALAACEIRGAVPLKHWKDDVALMQFLRSL